MAERYGVSRRSVHAWVKRYEELGLAGLADRSHRPHAHPWQLAPEMEAAICEMRRAHHKWGPSSHDLDSAESLLFRLDGSRMEAQCPPATHLPKD